MRFARWEAFLDTLAEPLAFYDLETTHMQPEKAQIVEFGVALYGPASLWDGDPQQDARSLIPGLLYTYEQRVNPGADVLTSGAFRRASKIHHITAADLQDVTFTTDDLQDIAAQLLGSGTVCGFNSAEYDDTVLWPGCPDHALRTRIDVLRVVRAVLSTNPSPEVTDPEAVRRLVLQRPYGCLEHGTTAHYKETLSALSLCILGADHKDAHGALPDCLRSAEILAALMELWPLTCPNTLDGLRALTVHPDGDKPPHERRWDGWDRMLHRETPADEWVFRGGKHRGDSLDDVRATDRGYLQWMLSSKADFGEDTKALIRAALR